MKNMPDICSIESQGAACETAVDDEMKGPDSLPDNAIYVPEPSV